MSGKNSWILPYWSTTVIYIITSLSNSGSQTINSRSTKPAIGRTILSGRRQTNDRTHTVTINLRGCATDIQIAPCGNRRQWYTSNGANYRFTSVGAIWSNTSEDGSTYCYTHHNTKLTSKIESNSMQSSKTSNSTFYDTEKCSSTKLSKWHVSRNSATGQSCIILTNWTNSPLTRK
jgi:hypothetical protein